MISYIKRLYNIKEESDRLGDITAKHVDGRTRYTSLQTVESMNAYKATGSYEEAGLVAGASRNTIKEWMTKFGDQTAGEIRTPTARLGKNRIHANVRRESLLGLVKATAMYTSTLVECLDVTSNTVRNDIRVLLRSGKLINLSTEKKTYFVKAA